MHLKNGIPYLSLIDTTLYHINDRQKFQMTGRNSESAGHMTGGLGNDLATTKIVDNISHYIN